MKKQNGPSSKNSNRPGNGRGRPQQGMAAAAYATGVKSMEPRITTGPRSARIQHRELVDTIPGSTSFAVYWSFILNPGMSETFNWLATQAANWEQYRFHKLCFHYISRCGSTTVGSVILSPDYDSMDAPPEVEGNATNNRDAVEDAPWKEFSCVLDPVAMHPNGPRKYVRSTYVVPGADYKTYDAGQLHVCTSEMANTDAVGKLWVEYDVEFFVPQVTPGTPIPPVRNFAQFNLSSAQTLTSTTATQIAFDEEIQSGALYLSNTLGNFVATISGWYYVQADLTFNDSSAEAFTALVELRRSGGALSVPVLSSVGPITVGANGKLHVHVEGALALDAGQAFEIYATLTGAAGTLTAVADSCRVSAYMLM